MIIYREFAKNEKNMQELMKEIIMIYIYRGDERC